MTIDELKVMKKKRIALILGVVFAYLVVCGLLLGFSTRDTFIWFYIITIILSILVVVFVFQAIYVSIKPINSYCALLAKTNNCSEQITLRFVGKDSQKVMKNSLGFYQYHFVDSNGNEVDLYVLESFSIEINENDTVLIKSVDDIVTEMEVYHE